MKRGRIVALVVVLAAVVTAVVVGRERWLWFAYEEERAKSRGLYAAHGVTSEWPIALYATVLRKRSAWIPGPRFIVPDQVCPDCADAWGDHSDCFPERAQRAWYGLEDGTKVDLPVGFRCLCANHSHCFLCGPCFWGEHASCVRGRRFVRRENSRL